MSTEVVEEQAPSVPSAPFEDFPIPSTAFKQRCPGTNFSTVAAKFRVRKTHCGTPTKMATTQAVISPSKWKFSSAQVDASLYSYFKSCRNVILTNAFTQMTKRPCSLKQSIDNRIGISVRPTCLGKFVSTLAFMEATFPRPCKHASDGGMKREVALAKRCSTMLSPMSGFLFPVFNLPRVDCRVYEAWVQPPGARTWTSRINVAAGVLIDNGYQISPSTFCYVTEKKIMVARGKRGRCENVLAVSQEEFEKLSWKPSIRCNIPNLQSLNTVQLTCRSMKSLDVVSHFGGIPAFGFKCKIYPTPALYAQRFCLTIKLADAPPLTFGRVFGGVTHRMRPITSGRVSGNWIRVIR